jgi:hypothetical protein
VRIRLLRGADAESATPKLIHENEAQEGGILFCGSKQVSQSVQRRKFRRTNGCAVLNRVEACGLRFGVFDLDVIAIEKFSGGVLDGGERELVADLRLDQSELRIR